MTTQSQSHDSREADSIGLGTPSGQESLVQKAKIIERRARMWNSDARTLRSIDGTACDVVAMHLERSAGLAFLRAEELRALASQ